MSELLYYINDPKNPMYNFKLGQWYENINHTASAASFYIRTAEFSSNNLLCYEALLRLAICFSKQGLRTYVVKGIFLRAISLIPERPEAYFLLSQRYELDMDWQESYTFASIGLTLKDNFEGLQTNVGYPGKYGFTYEKAISGWWIGLYGESLHLLRQLKKNPIMTMAHTNAVNTNLNTLGNKIWNNKMFYYDFMYEKLNFKFEGSKNIKRNYSSCYHDMFVLSMLNGKRNGKYMEIGCKDTYVINNMNLLEEFGWSGITIGITSDATKFDYESINNNYDYLQIDYEPALNSIEILLQIPFEKYKFTVITFKHNDYCSEGIKERSRKYLITHGYKMIVGNIAPDRYCNFEDWWVYPNFINKDIIDRMLLLSEETKRADLYMMNI